MHRGGSKVGVQGVRTPALLIRVPFFEKNLFFQNLLFREDEAKLRTQTFVYVVRTHRFINRYVFYIGN